MTHRSLLHPPDVLAPGPEIIQRVRMSTERLIRQNIRAHDRMSRRYEWIHGEIFNPIEQGRIAETVQAACSRIKSGRGPVHALDVGCGTGNLTRHLLRAGLRVTAADVSTSSLAQLRRQVPDPERRGRLTTLELNGRDLSNLPTGGFDLVAAYSLLHHVPDYLALVREMARVLAPGGVLYLDHEAARCSWSPSAEYRRYRTLGRPRWRSAERWRKFLILENYWFKLLRLRDPRLTAEGDLHVWPDDHIEWDQILRVLAECEVREPTYQEYLAYERGFDVGLYQQYKDRCADVAMVTAIKARPET